MLAGIDDEGDVDAFMMVVIPKGYGVDRSGNREETPNSICCFSFGSERNNRRISNPRNRQYFHELTSIL
jgi:hypothetical protein